MISKSIRTNSQLTPAHSQIEYPASLQASSISNRNEFQSSQMKKYSKIRLQDSVISEKGSTEQVNQQQHDEKSRQPANELYEKQIQMSIKAVGSEDNKSKLITLKIIIVLNSETNQQNLQFEISDEENLSLLYTLKLSESEYLTIKNDQNLLVDFGGFPQKLTELIELSQHNQTHSHSGSDSTVQFACIFEVQKNGEAIFKVSEVNPFQNLVHVQLKFRHSTDETIKFYLAKKLANAKENISKLSINSQSLQEQLIEQIKHNEEVKQLLEQAMFSNKQLKEELNLSHSQEILELKQEMQHQHSLFREESEKQQNQIIEQFRENISQLEEQIAQLNSSNSNIFEINLKHESSIRELNLKINIYEQELKQIEQIILETRAENTHLNNTRFTNENQIAELQARLQCLERTLADKEQIINNFKKIQSSLEDQKRTLEKEQSIKSAAFDKAMISIEKLNEDINNGNQSINQLREDLNKKTAKLENKKSIVQELETVILNMSKEQKELKSELLERNREKDNLQINNQEKEKQIKDLQQKIKEAAKIIQQNQSMIEYLNNKLNESQKSHSSIKGSSLSSQFRSTTVQLTSSSSQIILPSKPYERKYGYISPKTVDLQYQSPLQFSQKTNVSNAFSSTINRSRESPHVVKELIHPSKIDKEKIEAIKIRNDYNPTDESLIVPIKYKNPIQSEY